MKYGLDNCILTNEDAVKDCLVLNALILSILKDGKVKDSGRKDWPEEASSEKQRLQGVYDLVDKYCYGWYFTVDTHSFRVFTQDEQIQNLADFQSYILNNVGNKVIKSLIG